MVRRALKDLVNDGPPTKIWELMALVLISSRNNKNKSPGWLVSLVIGDYLAWFGEHLLG